MTTVSSAATTIAGENVRPWRGAVERPRHDDRRRRLDLPLAALAPPLEEDLVRVEAEVQRVVAQEALGVDRARQLAVLAALEGAQVARPDLRVALGAVEVDALALAGGEQALRRGRPPVRRPASAGWLRSGPRFGGGRRRGWSCGRSQSSGGPCRALRRPVPGSGYPTSSTAPSRAAVRARIVDVGVAHEPVVRAVDDPRHGRVTRIAAGR